MYGEEKRALQARVRLHLLSTHLLKLVVSLLACLFQQRQAAIAVDHTRTEALAMQRQNSLLRPGHLQTLARLKSHMSSLGLRAPSAAVH